MNYIWVWQSINIYCPNYCVTYSSFNATLSMLNLVRASLKGTVLKPCLFALDYMPSHRNKSLNFFVQFLSWDTTIPTFLPANNSNKRILVARSWKKNMMTLYRVIDCKPETFFRLSLSFASRWTNSSQFATVNMKGILPVKRRLSRNYIAPPITTGKN